MILILYTEDCILNYTIYIIYYFNELININTDADTVIYIPKDYRL